MSDFDKIPNQEESTIFSDPAHFNAEKTEKKQPKNRLLLKGIAAVLAVAILITGTALAFKYIPLLTVSEEPETPKITVTNTAEADVKNITVKNELGEVVLSAEKTETNGESSVLWTVEGVDRQLTSSASISSFAKNAISLTALEKLSKDGEFGFTEKSTTVKVTTADKEYTLTIGKTTPGEIGYYCKTTLDEENVYVINGAPAVAFITATELDFATTEGFESVKNSENSSCFSGDEITDFDYIKISGKKHPKPFKIVLQEDEGVNAYFAFKMVEPAVRICDNTNPQAILDVFAAGFASEGAYSYDTDKQTLKKFGLDNPDYVVTLSLKGSEYTLKFSAVDEEYAAFIDGKTNMVKKISLSAVSFAATPIESYYSGFITLENLAGLKQMKVDTPNGSYVFDIKYTEGAEQDFEISYNAKKLDVARFKDYYGTLIGMTPISYESDSTAETPLTVTFIHSGEYDDTVLKFKRSKELRYLAEIDGVPIGQVTSSAVDKFISDTVKTANGTY